MSNTRSVGYCTTEQDGKGNVEAEGYGHKHGHDEITGASETQQTKVVIVQLASVNCMRLQALSLIAVRSTLSSLEKLNEVYAAIGKLSFAKNNEGAPVKNTSGANLGVVQTSTSFCYSQCDQFGASPRSGNVHNGIDTLKRLPPPPSYGTMPLGRVYRSTTRGVASVWNGELSPRVYLNSTFSCKIFLGGVPRDVTEPTLVELTSPALKEAGKFKTFRKYGSCRVEWPVKETSSSLHANTKSNQHAKVSGYVYMIFESESSVKKVMSDCSQEFGFAGDCYFKMKLRRGQTNEIRQVQVVPWLISDAEYVARPGVRIDPKKAVFVGALHGMLAAQGLHSVMSEVFGDVVCVSIDTDRYRYPIGSGRVTFSSQSSYLRAIDSEFLDIKTSKFSKRIQIDPFLEESKCLQCESAEGPYFCRERSCMKYNCLQCWQVRHSASGPYGTHKALFRRFRRSMPVGSVGNRTVLSLTVKRVTTPHDVDSPPAHPLNACPPVLPIGNRTMVPLHQRMFHRECFDDKSKKNSLDSDSLQAQIFPSLSANMQNYTGSATWPKYG